MGKADSESLNTLHIGAFKFVLAFVPRPFGIRYRS